MSKVKILQVNKLYHPWIGGIESVVKNTFETLNDKTRMTVGQFGNAAVGG